MPLSFVFGELHVRQSNKLLTRQLTLLPGLLLEQLQHVSTLQQTSLWET